MFQACPHLNTVAYSPLQISLPRPFCKEAFPFTLQFPAVPLPPPPHTSPSAPQLCPSSFLALLYSLALLPSTPADILPTDYISCLSFPCEREAQRGREFLLVSSSTVFQAPGGGLRVDMQNICIEQGHEGRNTCVSVNRGRR